jgi:hypothetical protein
MGIIGSGWNLAQGTPGIRIYTGGRLLAYPFLLDKRLPQRASWILRSKGVQGVARDPAVPWILFCQGPRHTKDPARGGLRVVKSANLLPQGNPIRYPMLVFKEVRTPCTSLESALGSVLGCLRGVDCSFYYSWKLRSLHSKATL